MRVDTDVKELAEVMGVMLVSSVGLVETCMEDKSNLPPPEVLIAVAEILRSKLAEMIADSGCSIGEAAMHARDLTTAILDDDTQN